MTEPPYVPVGFDSQEPMEVRRASGAPVRILKILFQGDVNGVRAAAKQDVPVDWLHMLFGYTEIVSPRGLYMHVPAGKTVQETKGVQVGAYKRDGNPSGAEVIFHGVRLTLDLIGDGGTHRESDAGSLKVHRPSGIWFDHKGNTTFHIAFEWGDRVAAYESVALNVLAS